MSVKQYRIDDDQIKGILDAFINFDSKSLDVILNTVKHSPIKEDQG